MFNGRGNRRLCSKQSTGKVVATNSARGKPEFAAGRSAGGARLQHIEDKSEVAVIDTKTHAVVATWPIAPGGKKRRAWRSDLEHHRLFSLRQQTEWS